MFRKLCFLSQNQYTFQTFSVVAIGSLSLLGGLLVLLLPETNNKALADSIEDAENIGTHPHDEGNQEQLAKNQEFLSTEDQLLTGNRREETFI